MTREEANNFHDEFYGADTLKLNIQDLEDLLKGGYICTSVNYEYSLECSLDIDKDIRDKLLTSLLALKELDPLEHLIDNPIDSPTKLVKGLSLTFGINFSIKADYEKSIWILSTDSILDEDTTLKIFEYIYNKKYGLWSVDTSNFFNNMSYVEYCNKNWKDDI